MGPDVETWLQKEQYESKPGIVAQWTRAHSTVAANWVKADPLNGEYVKAWKSEHLQEVAQWKNDNPSITGSKPEDLAAPFFFSFSALHPGMFPSVVEYKSEGGETAKRIEPVNRGTDIQGMFFDLWRQEHADIDLEPVPADMVMASGSGLDPHITLKNALYQLDRVAAWQAGNTNRNIAEVSQELEEMLHKNATAPLGDLVGVKLVNVLEVNLILRERFGKANR